MRRFETQHMCTFAQTNLDRLLLDLAWRYHEECEVYDRLHCTAMKGKIAMPANGEERTLMARHARDVHGRLWLEARDLGFTSSQWHDAIISTARRFEESL